MSDPEATTPNWKARTAGWLKTHPEFTIPAITFLCGLILGAILF